MPYFDHNATTPVDPAVAEVLSVAVRELWGNASSVHAPGQAARQALETARRSAAARLNAAPAEIVFTSGGTESNNLAIFGALRASGKPDAHVVTTTIEHPSVLTPIRQLEMEGIPVSYVRVSSGGIVDPDDIHRQLRPETVLVSVGHANNEVGAVQPIADIARIAHANGSLLHSDGVQAVGKIPVDLRALDVDLYSVSAHKLYAPKGVGLLYVRKNTTLAPLLFGGRHERERRAGTENVPGVIAFSKALEIARGYDTHSLALRDGFEALLRRHIPGVQINAINSPRLPNTSSVTFPGISAEALLIALDMRGMAVSTGSACSSGSVEPSHVLLQMGLSRADARSTLRLSFGRSNHLADVDALVDALAAAATRHRREVRYA